MNNEKLAENHIRSTRVALNSVLEEIEREGYETVAQVVGSIQHTLDIVAKLEQQSKEGDQHE